MKEKPDKLDIIKTENCSSKGIVKIIKGKPYHGRKYSKYTPLTMVLYPEHIQNSYKTGSRRPTTQY